MRICILCDNENVEAARTNSLVIFPKTQEIDPETIPAAIRKFKENKPAVQHLGIPVSETGNLPATHWFCFMEVTEDIYNNIMNNKLYSTVEISSPKDFLEKWNLKLIK